MENYLGNYLEERKGEEGRKERGKGKERRGKYRGRNVEFRRLWGGERLEGGED